VSAGEMEIDDGLEGNDDGMAGPGETFELSVSLRNEGDESASDVDAVLTSDDPLVEVLEGTAHYGDIAPGADSEPTSAFSLSVDPTCPDAHVALLDLTVSEGDVRTVWPEAVSLTVSAPVASVAAYSVDDTRDGDGDGSPEPGEGFLLMVDVRNRGGAPARSPVVEVASLDPYLSVVDGTVGLDDVAPGDGRQCVFEMSVSPGCPLPSFPEIELELTTSFGYSSVDTFAVAVGRTGMTDDFESGAPGWTHGGEGDLWTLSDNRSHSGATSWYSGGEGWQYDDGMDASLVSPEFVAGVDTELRFWMWYEFPIYHEDGLYVEILQGNEAVDTLDFIGSGGALNHLGSIGNTWLEYGYSLERDPGETLSVRFRLSTDDADVAEGVYLDDVVVTSGVVPTETGAEPASAADVPALLRQNRPNPFTSSTTIAFTMFTEAPVALSVYNIQGRLIRTVLEDVRGRGDHSMTWDGKDELGVDVAAGVYLYRLSVADYEDTGKMILVR